MPYSIHCFERPYAPTPLAGVLREGFKVKGKASVQSDMKLHSKRSADKEEA